LTNVTSSAAPGLEPGATSYNTSQIVPNPNQYMFWDDLHPTTAVHAIFGSRVLDLFRLPGDFNRNDTVDAADYIVWRKGLATTYIPNDFDVWRTHFGAVGNTSGTSLITRVPEPAATILLVLVLTLALATGRTCRWT
jgi:hypothetical protein